MKKILALILALVMSMTVLAGCGGDVDTMDANEKAYNEAQIAKYWAFEEAYKNDGATEVLKVAISPDFAPMEFMETDKNKVVGFDVLLAMYIAKELNMKLEIVTLDFGACQVAVQTGTVDCSISGFSVTDERKENCNLSDYYYAGENETEQVIIVKADKANKYSKADDFAGLKIGAQGASLQENLCKAQLPGSTIEVYGDINTAVQALLSGIVDGVAVAKGNAESIMANNDKVALSGFEFEVSSEEENNVVLIGKGNDDLTNKINAVLAKAYAAGLYGEWYEASKALSGINTAAEISFDENGNPIVDAE